MLVAADDDAIYYVAQYQKLDRVLRQVAEGKCEKLADVKGEIRNLVAADGDVAWCTERTIYFLPRGERAPSVIADGIDGLANLTIGDHAVFWTDTQGVAIFRGSRFHRPVQRSIEYLPYPFLKPPLFRAEALAFDGKALWMIYQSNHNTWLLSLDTKSGETISRNEISDGRHVQGQLSVHSGVAHFCGPRGLQMIGPGIPERTLFRNDSAWIDTDGNRQELKEYARPTNDKYVVNYKELWIPKEFIHVEATLYVLAQRILFNHLTHPDFAIFGTSNSKTIESTLFKLRCCAPEANATDRPDLPHALLAEPVEQELSWSHTRLLARQRNKIIALSLVDGAIREFAVSADEPAR